MHVRALTSLLTCPITKFWGFWTCSQSFSHLEQPQGLSSINSPSLTTGSSQSGDKHSKLSWAGTGAQHRADRTTPLLSLDAQPPAPNPLIKYRREQQQPPPNSSYFLQLRDSCHSSTDALLGGFDRPCRNGARHGIHKPKRFCRPVFYSNYLPFESWSAS